MVQPIPMQRRPTSPGEMLREEFLIPMGLSQTALAEKMGVTIQCVNSIVNGRLAVTARTAILLSRALGTTPEFWLNNQTAVDLWDELELERLRSSRPHPSRPGGLASRRSARKRSK